MLARILPSILISKNLFRDALEKNLKISRITEIVEGRTPSMEHYYSGSL